MTAGKTKQNNGELEIIRTRIWTVFFGDPSKRVKLNDDLEVYQFGYPAEEIDADMQLYLKLYDIYGRPPSADEYATVVPRMTVADLRQVKPGLELVAVDSFFEDWGRKYYHFVDETGLDRPHNLDPYSRAVRQQRAEEINQFLYDNLSMHRRKGIKGYGQQVLKVVRDVMRNPSSMLEVEVLCPEQMERRPFSSIDFELASEAGVYIDIEPIFAARYILGNLATINSKYVIPHTIKAHRG